MSAVIQSLSAVLRAFGKGFASALLSPNALVDDYHRATRR
jgi:hypothetical protein